MSEATERVLRVAEELPPRSPLDLRLDGVLSAGADHGLPHRASLRIANIYSAVVAASDVPELAPVPQLERAKPDRLPRLRRADRCGRDDRHVADDDRDNESERRGDWQRGVREEPVFDERMHH